MCGEFCEPLQGRGRQFENATLGAFSPPQQREGARRVQSPEAMAIEDNLAGITRYRQSSCGTGT